MFRARMDHASDQVWICFVTEHIDWHDSISLQVIFEEDEKSKLVKKSAKFRSGVKRNPHGKQEVV